MRTLLLCVLATLIQAQGVFLVQPYLQLGNAPRPSAMERLDLMWHAEDCDAAWSVEVHDGHGWTIQAAPVFRRLDTPPLPPHRIYRATLRNLPPGKGVAYRVKRNGEVVFGAEAQARKPGSHRWVVFGDAADGSTSERAIAQAVEAVHPDAVFIAGDLVYGRGRAAEYRDHFFPVYNSETVPLMRRVPFLGVPGNHDVPFAKWPDAAAYFAYWSLPLNGPPLKAGDASAAPVTKGVHEAMVAAAGPAFPSMASYSFDYGMVHWTVLDSNPYADWGSPVLKAWLEADLRSAKHAAWRIVTLHHPLFQSSRAHEHDQWMRPISPILEKYGVDLVLAGHVHNYQRTAPLRFYPTKISPRGKSVEGYFTVDEEFDGKVNTHAHGIIHIVTGAGGAELYDGWQTLAKTSWQPWNRAFSSDNQFFTVLDVEAKTLKLRQLDAKTSWQPWTRAFISDKHSFTVLDVEAKTLKLRQLDAEGHELDTITLTR